VQAGTTRGTDHLFYLSSCKRFPVSLLSGATLGEPLLDVI